MLLIVGFMHPIEQVDPCLCFIEVGEVSCYNGLLSWSKYIMFSCVAHVLSVYDSQGS